MLVVLTEIYCNKVDIQITQRDDFIQIVYLGFNFGLVQIPHVEMQRCRWKLCLYERTAYLNLFIFL